MALSTTSFVTEVLASAGKFEREDLNAKLGRLSNRIDEVKVQVYESLRKQYGHFEPSLETAVELTQQYQTVMDDMTGTCTRIETEIKNQLNTSTVEFAELSTELSELTSCLGVIDRLVQIHAAQEAADVALLESDFTTVTSSLNTIEHLLKREVDREEKEQEIDILQRLHEAHQKSKSDLSLTLDDCWRKYICWNFKKSKKKSAKKTGEEGVELRICASEEGQKKLKNATQAMHNMNLLNSKLNNFGKSYLSNIIKPMIAGQEYQKAMTGSDAQISIQPPKDASKISTSLTLSALQSVFTFLHNHLLKFKVSKTDQGSGKQKRETVSLMRLLGEQIADEVLQVIIEDCLAPAIPTSNKELEQYKQVIQLTETLQKTLLDLEFIVPGNIVLLDYVQNINVHFANKKCQEILEQARHLMTSDLYNTVEVNPDEPLGDLVVRGRTVSASKSEPSKSSAGILPKASAISANTFRLPTCQISLSVQKLIVLAYEMLHEATTSGAACAVQLFYSVGNMFELFCCVVPTFHKSSLTTIPQLAAIHHNNCMYIAHHMMTLGHQFSAKLPPPLNTQTATFVHLVPKMRRLGAECFLQMMTVQKNQMVEYLAGAQGFMNVSENNNQVQAQRAVNQCLVQLEHLSHVWKDVLPALIYQKAMGTLLNSILLDIITCVITLEDISADDTSAMSNIFSSITEKAPSFITVEKDDTPPEALLLKHVPKWPKFIELDLLLNGNLQSILDRWTEGKGPLAAHFTANEVKQLIRALFQNTDRRAAVLGKIR